MKTLVFFGSARKSGHTKKILDELLNKIGGDVEIIDAYRTKDISSCVDCRFCWKTKGCAIDDDMQEIYKKVEESDIILIASPVYFHSITGELKRILDRCQVYWASHVRGDKPEVKTKKGGYILTGGAPRFLNQFQPSQAVCEGVLGDLDATVEGEIIFYNSDVEQFSDNEVTVAQIERLAKKLIK